MKTKVALGILLLLGVAWNALSDPPVKPHVKSSKGHRSAKATPPLTTPSLKPAIARAITLAQATPPPPGIYTAKPYSMIVVVPVSPDPKIAINPGTGKSSGNLAPSPEVTLVPLRR
jgi:hypothetical protein